MKPGGGVVVDARKSDSENEHLTFAILSTTSINTKQFLMRFNLN
jgi:hypothetical protein